MTDQDLLRAYAVSRDVESLSAFVLRHQQPLLRFVGRLLADEHAAQDVVQETFLRVARHPARVMEADNCHNWLLRVARNIGMDHMRRTVRQRKHTGLLAVEQSSANAHAVPDVQVAAVERHEQRTRVHEEIARLPPRHRELLLLRIQEQKSYREIAEITGLTATNVGFILHQAMTALAQRLGKAKGESS